ncbi:MAG: hypothetical protein ACJAYU_001824 [Bradymonadia bacterium]|jgi:hypothetical protein
MHRGLIAAALALVVSGCSAEQPAREAEAPYVEDSSLESDLPQDPLSPSESEDSARDVEEGWPRGCTEQPGRRVRKPND